MEIKVEVSGVDLSSVIGEDRVVDEDGDHVGVRKTTLADVVAEKLADECWRLRRQEIDDAVGRILDEVIRARVEVLVDTALQRPLRKTNVYGEPIKGSETTLTEMIMEIAEGWATEHPRDEHGRPLMDRVGNHLRTTNLQYLINKAVDKTFTAKLQAAVAEQQKKATDAVREHAATILAGVLKEGFQAEGK
jgi:hypothetical protein